MASQKLQRTDRTQVRNLAVRDLVCCCAPLGAVPIPEEIVIKDVDATGGGLGPQLVNPIVFSTILSEAERLGLIKHNADEKLIELR